MIPILKPQIKYKVRSAVQGYCKKKENKEKKTKNIRLGKKIVSESEGCAVSFALRARDGSCSGNIGLMRACQDPRL